jgi:hypothetical protein
MTDKPDEVSIARRWVPANKKGVVINKQRAVMTADI